MSDSLNIDLAINSLKTSMNFDYIEFNGIRTRRPYLYGDALKKMKLTQIQKMATRVANIMAIKRIDIDAILDDIDAQEELATHIHHLSYFMDDVIEDGADEGIAIFCEAVDGICAMFIVMDGLDDLILAEIYGLLEDEGIIVQQTIDKSHSASATDFTIQP